MKQRAFDTAVDKRDPLTEQIIGCAMTVHTRLGGGLLESAYQTGMCRELEKAGLTFDRQVALPIEYDGLVVDVAYRLDIVVAGLVIVELKTVAQLLPVHSAQLRTYLRFAKIETGLLLNFHAHPFRTGIRRVSIQRPHAVP